MFFLGDEKDYEFKRSWLLPVMRDNISRFLLVLVFANTLCSVTRSRSTSDLKTIKVVPTAAMSDVRSRQNKSVAMAGF